MGKRYVVIPAYEPGENLPALVSEVTAAGLVPVVVDDGSGQGYREILEQVSAEAAVLHHEVNKGKGQALKTAFFYIKNNEAENGDDFFVVTMDSDGQHTVADALKLLKAAEKEPQTLILGSRALKKGTPARSRLGNDITRLVFCLASGSWVHDTQTGLRAFSGRLLPELLEIPGERYEYEMNMLLDFARKKKPMREVEIETIYIGKHNDTTHFDTLKDSWRIYRDLLGFSLSSFACFLLDLSLFAALSALLAGRIPASVAFANVLARCVSAFANYTINRKMVFKSHTGAFKSASQYFLLAAAVLIGGTTVLDLLTGAGLARIPAKLITEALFFMLSWFVQRKLIFPEAREVTAPSQVEVEGGEPA